MRVDGNGGGTIGYQPNSKNEWAGQPEFREPPLALSGAAEHWNHRTDDDYSSQPRALFQLMCPASRRSCSRIRRAPSAALRWK
jgi:catalase